MLMATQNPVSFAARVGVAPSTTTMTLPLGAAQQRYYMPYASLEDLKAGGLGIINEGDAWLTGRPYGLPGTATVRLTQHQGGYQSPEGYHYDASMVGGGFGDADTANVALQLQAILQQQQAQAASLKRVAFWQMAMGALTITAVTASVAIGVVRVMRKRQH
jgi:hypothetical protein